MRWLPPACSLLFVAACGTATPSTSAANDAPLTFELRATVPPSSERFVCQLVRMPDATGEIFVGGGRYAMSDAAHHFLLFRTDGVDPALPFDRPVDCFEGSGLMRFERGYVTGGAKRSEAADFPEGAALAFQPRDVLLFQGHFLNPGASPVDALVHVEMHIVPAGSVKDRVGTFRFYDPYISVGAHARGGARMRCPVTHDVTLLSAGSHMHRRGIGYRAYLDLPGQPRSQAPFYSTADWENPSPFLGPLAVPAGSFLRFACDYDNRDATTVVQGPSADANEMCMFSAFYVPAGSADEDACAHGDEHGTGARSCEQTLGCIQTCPRSEAPRFDLGRADVGPCFQACIEDGCANVTGALFPELLCAQAKCDVECQSYGEACSACVASRCMSELRACANLACASSIASSTEP